jgi:hypothetical protein
VEVLRLLGRLEGDVVGHEGLHRNEQGPRQGLGRAEPKQSSRWYGPEDHGNPCSQLLTG